MNINEYNILLGCKLILKIIGKNINYKNSRGIKTHSKGSKSKTLFALKWGTTQLILKILFEFYVNT